ncbi:hypothetical protein ACIQGZ_15705 [Streptomyces sp. NPDC092296]|uniref:hypothetical protein n=1 Tax=Streptomyces sp. NPDC092296 TaxID=3366012 RepID=UPI0038185175
MSAETRIVVSGSTKEQVRLLAAGAGISEGEMVSRLVKSFLESAHTGNIEEAAGVKVHAVYEGQRADGQYDPATRSLTITSGPAQGWYKSPSGAAAAVLQAHNPGINPNRNGWSFWTVTTTGKLLQTIR